MFIDKISCNNEIAPIAGTEDKSKLPFIVRKCSGIGLYFIPKEKICYFELSTHVMSTKGLRPITTNFRNTYIYTSHADALHKRRLTYTLRVPSGALEFRKIE